jgi:hypothetical protein
MTPLMTAATHGHTASVRRLLAAGADALLALSRRGDALDAAEHEGHDATARVLREAIEAKGRTRERARLAATRRLPEVAPTKRASDEELRQQQRAFEKQRRRRAPPKEEL